MMKTFRYRYKDNKGAIIHDTIQSSDRVCAIRELREKGLIIVAVDECAGIPKSDKVKKVCFIGVVICLLFVPFLVWMLCFKIESGVGVKAKTSGRVEAVAAPNKYAPPKMTNLHNQKIIGPNTNMTMAQKAERPVVKSSGEMVQEPVLDQDNREMKTETEVLLSMLHSTDLGNDPTPMPIGMSEEEANIDAKNSFTNVLVITDKDSAADEKRKEAVAWSKMDIKEYMSQGGSALDFIKKSYEYRKDISNARDEEIRNLINDAYQLDPDEFNKKLQKINNNLKQEGIKTINEDELFSWLEIEQMNKSSNQESEIHTTK